MRALVAEYGRCEYEQGVRSIAAKRGLPVDVVRAEVTADLERKIAIRRDLEADPARLESLIEEFRERQRTRSFH